MTSINRIAVLGAGAMGAAFAARFYDMDPASVYFIARGDRREKLRADGLIVNDKHYNIPAVAPDEPGPPADLILVALKHHHLSGALHDLKNHVGDHTVILSVMNGLDSEPMLGGVYGMDKLLYCISVGIDAQRCGNVVHFSNLGKLIFGEANNTTLSPRVQAVQAVFERASIPYETPQDMIRMMWWKFMINVGVNQASAVTRAPYGVFQSDPHAQAVMEAAMREVIAVAQAANVNLSLEDLTNWYPVLNTLSPQGRTSMLQDIEAGRKTEVEIFAGKMIALGEQYGVPTPVNTMLFHTIKVLERDVDQPA